MTENIMRNKSLEETMILIQCISRQGKVTEIDDAAVGASVSAICGIFFAGLPDKEKIENNTLRICITKDIDIEVADVDTEEKIISRDRTYIPQHQNPLLIYGLTEKFEFLMYRALNTADEFLLRCELGSSRSAENIVKKVSVSEYYKVYIELRNMINQLTMAPLCVFPFSYGK